MIFRKLLGTIDAGNILDVGCGSGQFIEILSGSLHSFVTITGVDVDAESLRDAGEKFNSGKFSGRNSGDGKFRFLEAGSQKLPFADESFDMVTISKALHHVEDPEASLTEMKRVLKSGGHFLINEMHRDQLSRTQESHLLYHHLRSEIDNMLGISHNHTFYREDLIRLADGLGLRDRTILEYSPDSSGAGEPDNINEYIRKMKGWIQEIEEHPERKRIEKRVDALSCRIQDYGISRPPQMVIMGRK